MKKGDQVEYSGSARNATLKGNKFTVSETKNDIGVVKFEEGYGWYDQKDFKVIGRATNKPHVQIPDFRPSVPKGTEVYIVFTIDNYAFFKTDLDDPDAQEYIRTIARLTIKLRYPKTRPFVVRIEELELIDKDTKLHVKATYTVLETKIFKR